VKKTLLTGIKPTGSFHLGNYVGAVKPFLEIIQNESYESYLFIADYHSLNSIKDSKMIQHSILSITSALLACGVDSEKTIIYRQSDIPELFELNWILSCSTPKGLLNRAHAYKAQIQKEKQNVDQKVNMGLFNYPILMAADILLFQSDRVPVGFDQAQHLEMTREIASKFNSHYKTSLLVLPQMTQNKQAVLKGIDGNKMSKSYNNHIPLFCPPKELKKLVMKIQTDSLDPSEPKDPQTSIIFNIYKEFANAQETQNFKNKLLKGCGWGEAKQDLFVLLENKLTPKKEIYDSLMKNPNQVYEVLEAGAKKARQKSQKMLTQIKDLIFGKNVS